MTHTHYFLAISLPDEIKKQLDTFVQRHKQSLPFKKWTHLEDYHITLVFLGAQPHDRLERLVTACQKLGEHITSFPIQLEGLSTFGQEERPRIFWAGVRDSAELSAFQQSVKTCCQQEEISVERRPYRPHVTLAKKWIGKGSFKEVASEVSQPPARLLHVTSFHLYRSHIGKTPSYEIIESFPLRGQ
ncbi:RNA 2',3'-cyclic phosphodiesterase [Halalkalibacterium halodurans]|jgi:2'-5' RNA ligase|uniref:RNA 2',3'-cyclic phosphodiesterase n=1 Tax=Halalkalibacterium halodurans TaxID=86665 RepID=A0A0M0KHY2_ALKHA|nr:RNA 2',3'-cyclic phosphodiesterase [Halalkalibacterium halodurans]MED3645978.1 RNA 2',3'-cyclic phosphodiesterase [Halalkalibacterium halodurans]MED4164151.1 RNA 2',3'-cyclic phosphodiesterase [Halalkalibacterium halodurans]TPE67217.1 RNA 2',3'-cyclic phosphodiesterase [Halalkalibacterium halodurans]